MPLRVDECRACLRQERAHHHTIATVVAAQHPERIVVPRLDEPDQVLVGDVVRRRSVVLCDGPIPSVPFGWKVCGRM